MSLPFKGASRWKALFDDALALNWYSGKSRLASNLFAFNLGNVDWCRRDKQIAQIKKQIFIAKFLVFTFLPTIFFEWKEDKCARERGSSYAFVSSLQADAGEPSANRLFHFAKFLLFQCRVDAKSNQENGAKTKAKLAKHFIISRLSRRSQVVRTAVKFVDGNFLPLLVIWPPILSSWYVCLVSLFFHFLRMFALRAQQVWICSTLACGAGKEMLRKVSCRPIKAKAPNENEILVYMKLSVENCSVIGSGELSGSFFLLALAAVLWWM